MTLLELLDLIKQRLWLVILLPVLFSLLAGVYSYAFMADRYTASASLYVLTNRFESMVDSADTAASQQLANDMAALVKSDLIAQDAAKALGMKSLSGYFVDVSSQATNRVIFISVTGTDPDTAAAIANEIAHQASINATQIMKVDAVNVIDHATAPHYPSGPNRPKYIAVAFLGGLFLAIALIVLFDMLSTTVKSSEHAEELFGIPVIGKMPELKKGE